MLKFVEITKQTQKALKFFEEKVAFTAGPVEVKAMMNEPNVQIIDVRKREDYDKSHVPNAISIPGTDIERNLNKLSKDKINVLYCYTQQCHLAAKSAVILAKNGYPVMEMEGGFDAWRNIYDFEVVS